MKLTKEECLKYKKELQWAYDNVGTKYENNSIKDAISLGIVYYEKLMNENFGNPPLKFEELEVGNTIYDSVLNKKGVITRITNDEWGLRVGYIWIEKSGIGNHELIKFEDERFFSREVKENE